MTYTTITEDGTTRIIANVTYTDGIVEYVEIPFYQTLEDDAAAEAFIRNYLNAGAVEYAEDGTELPFESNIVSVQPVE